MKNLLRTASVVALGGLLLAVYTYLHKQGFTAGEFCNIDDVFSCDVVNKGKYSNFFGVPVSLIGIIGYAILLAGAILKQFKPKDKMLTLFLFVAADLGFMFSLYLTYLEAFVLHAWCILCITSLVLILVLDILFLFVWLKERKQNAV